MGKLTRIFFLLLIPVFILVSWKSESIVVAKEKTKKVKIFEGKFTVPFDWRLTSNKTDSFLITGTDTITFSRTIPETFIPVLMAFGTAGDSAQMAEGKRLQAYNDSLIKAEPRILTHCMDSFHAKNSSFWISYLFPCKETSEKLYATIFIQKGGIIGVTTSKVNSARATQFIEILKAFQVKK